MNNPIRRLQKFVSENTDRLRRAARDAVHQLSAPDEPGQHQDSEAPDFTASDSKHTEFHSEHTNSDPIHDVKSGNRDANRDASVAYGGHHRHSEHQPPNNKPDSAPPPEEQTASSPTSSTPDDDLSDSDPQGEDPGEAIGVLFDGNANSMRRRHPVSGHSTDENRHRQTRHLFVTTGESTGRRSGGHSGADVTLDVSRLDLDKLELEVDDLNAQIALQARIAELVDINVGADVQLGEVELDLQGVNAEALLEVHLDEIRQILGRALKRLEQRPELLSQALNTAERAADEAGDAAESATDEISDATHEATRQVSEPSIQAESRAEFSDDHSRN